MFATSEWTSELTRQFATPAAGTPAAAAPALAYRAARRAALSGLLLL